MSALDEIRKRRELLEIQKAGGSQLDVAKKQVSQNRKELAETGKISYSVNLSPVKSTKTTTKKDSGWLSAFDDGYQIGDISKTILKGGGSLLKTGYNVGKEFVTHPIQTTKTIGVGLASGASNAIDAINGAAADFIDWVAPDALQERWEKRKQGPSLEEFNAIAKNGTPEERQKLYLQLKSIGQDELAESLLIEEPKKDGLISKIDKAINTKYYETDIYKKAQEGKLSDGQETVFDVSSSVGNQLPAALVSVLATPAAGKAVFFAQSQQNYTEQAKTRGYTDTEARTYGMVMGGFETLLNKLGFDEVGGLSKLSQTSLKKAMIGEGLEEFVTPYIDSTVKSVGFDEKFDLQGTTKEAFEGAVMGAVVGGIMSAGGRGLAKVDRFIEKVNNGEEITQNDIVEAGRELEQNDPSVLQEAMSEVPKVVQEQTTQQPTETVEQLEKEIVELDSQLNENLSDEQYEAIQEQIRIRENKIEQIENGTTKIEQTVQPTTQEVETKSLVDASSNTLETGNIQERIENLQNEIVAEEQLVEKGLSDDGFRLAELQKELQELQTKQESPVNIELSPVKSGPVNEQVSGQVTDNVELTNNIEEDSTIEENELDEDTIKETQEERKISKEWTDKVQRQDQVNRPLAIEQAKKTGKNTMVGYSPILSNSQLYSKGSLSWVTPEGKLNSKVVEETKIDEFLSKNKIDKLKNGINTFENGLENKLSPVKEETSSKTDENNNFPIKKGQSEWTKTPEGITKHFKDLQKALNEGKKPGDRHYQTDEEVQEVIDSSIAMLNKDLAKQQTTSNVQEVLSPINEAVKDLKQVQKEVKKQVTELKEQIEEVKALTKEQGEELSKQYQTTVEQLNEMVEPENNRLSVEAMQRYKELQIMDEAFGLSDEQQIEYDNLRSIKNNDLDLSKEFGEKTSPVKSPLEDRDIEDVGKRKIKAYQYEHPEFRPFFQKEAQHMLYDLKNTTKGERILTGDTSQFGNANSQQWAGIKRQTTEAIAYLKDNYNYSYDEIQKGLEAIIKDNGAENIAVAKRIEILLDERLREGYTDPEGYEIPANEDYLEFLRTNDWTDYYSNLEQSNIEPTQEVETMSPVKPIEYEAPRVTERLNIDSIETKMNPKQPKVVSPIESKQPTKTEKTTASGDIKGVNTPTRKDVITKYQNKAIQAFASKGYDINEVFKKAKSLSTFASVDNTPERFIEKTLGIKEGAIFNELTTYQIAKNETEGVKWLNSYTNRKDGLIAQLAKEYKIKPGSKESAAAQMYGEGFYVDDNGEYIKYGYEQLKADFPNGEVRRNIMKLAKDPRVRQVYDDTLKRINESRVRNGYNEIPRLDNYYLHYRAMEDTFSKIGIPFNPNDIRAKDLPTDLNGVTADLKPGKPYFASEFHRKGNKTTYDLLGGFERYLGSAKNQIFHIDDIQTHRALRNMIADTYGQAQGLENIDMLSEEEQVTRLEQVYGSHLSNFAKFLHEQANVLAGKTALIDRGLEGIIGRRGIQFIDTLNKQVGANLIAFNVSPSLTNLVAPVQATAKTNKFSVLKAFGQTIGNNINKMFGRSDGFMENDPTAIRRRGAEAYSRTAWQKVQDVGYSLMGAVDNISTELILRMKYNELVDKKGMSHEDAQREAGRFAMRILGDRSLGQMPQIFNSKMMNTVLKFQLEVRNQLDSQFYDTFRDAELSTKDINNKLEKNKKKAAQVTSTLVSLAVLQHLFGKGFEEIAGYNPTFDIISVLMATFGLDDDEESEDTFIDNLWDGANELVGDLPYASTFTGGRIPISEALPLGELLSGEDQFGNEKSRLKTLGEAIPYYLLPGGYSQIKKTTQGLSMYDSDNPVPGSYTDSGNLRFALSPTVGNIAQSALFGKWSSEEARNYIDSDFQTIDKDHIDEFKNLGMTTSEYRKYRNGLAKARAKAKNNDEISQTEAIFDYINSLDVSDEQKAIMFENQFSNKLEDDAKEELNALNMSKDEKISYYSSRARLNAYTNDYNNEVKKLKDLYGENSDEYKEQVETLSKERQREVISEVLDSTLNDEQKKYLYNKYYSSDEALDKITNNGTAIDTYLEYKLNTLDYESEKDKDGDTINGSLAKKKINYLLSSGLNDNDVQTLYENDVLSGFDNKKKYTDYKAVKNMGVDINSWLNYSVQEFEADYNKKGNPIQNSKKNKVIKYVNSLPLSIPQKAAIIRTQYTSFDDYNNSIVKYVSGLDISYEEKVSTLEALDFKVYDDGTVKWE